MRKRGLLVAAASMALGGSFANADFTITSSRQTGAIVNPAGAPAGSYDIVDFTITGSGSNAVSGVSSIDAALYSSSGMLIGVGAGGKSGVATNQADLFFVNSANQNVSWIADDTANFSLSSTSGDSNSGHGAVLLHGGNPTSTPGADPLSTSPGYTNNELVDGISGIIFNSGGTAQATPILFAQAVVPTGATVELFNPSGTKSSASPNAGRAFGAGSGIFSPGGGLSNAAVNDLSSPYTDPQVPEPASFGLLGMGAAGLIARRRRRA